MPLWPCLPAQPVFLLSCEDKHNHHNLSFRPAFLPDPNDGSLYSLGGKNSEGLTVRGTPKITKHNLPVVFSPGFPFLHLNPDHTFICNAENHAAPGVAPHLILIQSVSSPRNCPSLSLSWFKRLPVAVQTAFFTWVRLAFRYRTAQLSFAVVKQSPSKLNNLIWTRTKCLPDLFSFHFACGPLLNL